MGEEDTDGSAAKNAEGLPACRFVFGTDLSGGFDRVEDSVEDAGVIEGQKRQGHGQLISVGGCQSGQALVGWTRRSSGPEAGRGSEAQDRDVGG
jgi:hypothetical protein